MPKRRRPGSRRGFTLVELTVTLVLISLLTAVAISRIGVNRRKAWISTMRADLRNVAVAQESYFYDFGVYSADAAVLLARGLVVAPGVTIVVNEATAVGWSASTGHESTAEMCYLFIGAAAPIGAATEEGGIDCD